MTCKICGEHFVHLQFFNPVTLEPLPVCTSRCGSRFLNWQNGKRALRRKKAKLREMPARPIEVSVVL